MLIYSIMAIMLTSSIKNIWQYTFAKIRNRPSSSFKHDFILSWISSFITILQIYNHFTVHRYQQGRDERYHKLAVVLYAFLGEDFMSMTYTFGLYMMVYWSRILIIFRINSFIGPLLTIIQNMLKDVLKFILIYGLIVIIYASSSILWFMQIEGYTTIIDAFITLLSASLGEYNFEVFNSQYLAVNRIFANLFLISYLLVTNIVLLNFMVAILSNTYSRLINISQALYLNEVVKVRNILEYDPYYSGLISLPTPLNAVLIPLFPFFYWWKNKKFNNFILHCSYIPVIIVTVIFFTAFIILMLPFSYLVMLYKVFVSIWFTNKMNNPRWMRVFKSIWMIFMIPIILLLWMVVDIKDFVRSLYSDNIQMLNEQKSHDRIDIGKLNLLNYQLK